jgi:CopG family nickel-responsive transcriptional regulator
MKAPLVRFGVAMEEPLLSALDQLVKTRKATRSKVLSDLARAEVMQSQLGPDVEVVMTLTLVYDHHVPDLSEKLNSMQHELGDRVRATLHIHLSHEHCLEVIVMRGRCGDLERAAKTLLATRGVRHGGIEMIADIGNDRPQRKHAKTTSHGRRNHHPHS